MYMVLLCLGINFCTYTINGELAMSGRFPSLGRTFLSLWPFLWEICQAKERLAAGGRLSRVPGRATGRGSFRDSKSIPDYLWKMCKQIPLQVAWGK